MFLVELHLDVVLEVLLVVRFKILFYKMEIDNTIGRFNKKLQWFLKSNLNFNVPCRTYLDVVLEVLLVVRFKILSDKICR